MTCSRAHVFLFLQLTVLVLSYAVKYDEKNVVWSGTLTMISNFIESDTAYEVELEAVVTSVSGGTVILGFIYAETGQVYASTTVQAGQNGSLLRQTANPRIRYNIVAQCQSSECAADLYAGAKSCYYQSPFCGECTICSPNQITIPDRCLFPCSSCPAGFYCNSQGDVVACPQGNFCQAGSSSPQTCTAGNQCPYTEMSSPLSCDPQFYCPAGTVAQFKCAEGHERHTGTEEECITCEDGFYCDALVGDEGNKVICPEGFFCKDGDIQQCDLTFLCPEGSTEQEVESCFRLGGVEESLLCSCAPFFTGALCEYVLTPISKTNVTLLNSPLMDEEAFEFLETNFNSACACGKVFNGTTCSIVSDPLELLKSFYTAGIIAFRNASYDLASYAFERLAICAQNRIWEQEEKDALNKLLLFVERYLEEERILGFVEFEQEFVSALIAMKHIQVLDEPIDFPVNLLFVPVVSTNSFYHAMSVPFRSCNISGLEDIITSCGDPGSMNFDELLESAMALARCTLLPFDQIGQITLVNYEAFMIQSLYCIRSLDDLKFGDLTEKDLDSAYAQFLDIAYIMSESIGSSEDTISIINLATFGSPSLRIGATQDEIEVPFQPLIYFNEQLDDKISQIRLSASLSASSDATQSILSEIENIENAILDEVQNGFANLTGLLQESTTKILDEFKLATDIELISINLELELFKNRVESQLNRIEASAQKMQEYIGLLGGDRTNKLLEGLEKLVAIQFDIDKAEAALAIAQATLDLIKNIFAGVAAIALTCAGMPGAGAVVAMGIKTARLRRRMEEVLTGKHETTPDFLRERELEACTFSAFKDNIFGFVRALGPRGNNFISKITSKLASLPAGTAQKLNFAIANSLFVALTAYEASLLGEECIDPEDAFSTGYGQNFLRALVAQDDLERGLFGVAMAFQLAGLDGTKDQRELREVIAPYLFCNNSARRLSSACNPLDFIPKTSLGNNIRVHSLVKSAVSNLVSNVDNSLFNKALEIADALVDVGIEVKNFIHESTKAEILKVEAETNRIDNDEQVKAAIHLIRVNLLNISDAFIAAMTRMDFIQMGLPFKELVKPLTGVGEDAFQFLPAFWDSLFNDIMDVLEYEALICPQIESQQLIQRSYKDVMKERSLGVNSESDPVEFRRSLGAKQDKKKAQEEIKRKNKEYKETFEEMSKVTCPRFERTLRNSIDWGKSIHESIIEIVENYRKFELTAAQRDVVENRLKAQQEGLEKRKVRNEAYMLNLRDSFGENIATQEVLRTLKATAEVERNLQVMILLDKILVILREYCNAHFYADPSIIPKACETSFLSLAASANSEAEFLAELALKLEEIDTEIKSRWYESKYTLTTFDDEVLDVTELIDMDAFVESGYTRFSFTLVGPLVEAYDLDTNESTGFLRTGPYFCNHDNVGMLSFGLFFVDANDEIVGEGKSDIGMAITLNGPFFKAVDGNRQGFKLTKFEDIEYRYSKSVTLESGARVCRTDEAPTLFGELCDKGRSFEIIDDNLYTQVLPTPYANWDVVINEGADILREQNAVGVKIITTYKATRNENMRCRGERISYLKEEPSTTGGGPPQEAIIIASVVVASIVAIAGLVLARKRYLNNHLVEGKLLEESNVESVQSVNPVFEKNATKALSEAHELFQKGALSSSEYKAYKAKLIGIKKDENVAAPSV